MTKNIFFLTVLFSFIFPIRFSFSQESFPGGVESPEFRIITGKNTSNKVTWGDKENARDEFTAGEDTLNINFYPALRFTTQNDLKLHNTSIEQKTVVGAFYPEYDGLQLKSPGFFKALFNTVPAFYFQSDHINIDSTSITDKYKMAYRSNFLISNKSELPSSMKVGTYSYSRLPGNAFNPWGEDKETVLNFTFKGYIPELLIYDRVLKESELYRLHSYMAIKYALTIPMDYLNSEGKVIWDARKNQTYHHRVTALVKDLQGSLYQPIAATTYEEEFNGRHSFFYPANGSNRSVTIWMKDSVFKTCPDKSFLFWGDDAVKIDSLYLIDGSRFPGLWVTGRRWMMENNGLLSQETNIKIGNPLRTNLNTKTDFPAYYFIHQEMPFDLDDIIVFDQDTVLTKLAWKSDSTIFSFAVAEELRFKVKTASRKIYTDQGRCGNNFQEIIPSVKTDQLSSKGNFYYYKVRGALMPCIYRVVYSYSNGRLKFFCDGGVGNVLTYKVTDKEGNMIASGELNRELESDREGFKEDYAIPIQNLAKGNYKLEIKDQTKQTATLLLRIK